jgi:endogenous inhibitor of DNA gyrase (YacG/DUF329 family)
VQANCPQCGNKIVIDDARVPDRPFSVKCPKCQNAVKLPGKGAAAPGTGSIPAVPEAAPGPAGAAQGAGSEEMRAQMMAQLRREMSVGETPGTVGRALVVLPDKGVAGALTLALSRQGYGVDTLDDMDEGARLLEQGVYALVATARVAGAAGKGESLYQRMNRLGPDARRRVFLMLVGDEFKTGDGTQAFAALADVVVHSKDAAAADGVLRSTLAERSRLYQVFQDSKRRHETAAG